MYNGEKPQNKIYQHGCYPAAKCKMRMSMQYIFIRNKRNRNQGIGTKQKTHQRQQEKIKETDAQQFFLQKQWKNQFLFWTNLKIIEAIHFAFLQVNIQSV